MPWELVYAVEPRRGIPFGRNTAVRTAGDVDFVAFLDDDEIADAAWLAELLRVQRATGADVVTGTVLPMFERGSAGVGTRRSVLRAAAVPHGPPAVVRPHEQRPHRRRGLPADDPAPFNEAMGLNGGDDTHFFHRAGSQGYTIVWADDAIVHEIVPASRVNARWLLRREYRRGNTLSLCLRDLQDSPWRRIRRRGSRRAEHRARSRRAGPRPRPGAPPRSSPAPSGCASAPVC